MQPESESEPNPQAPLLATSSLEHNKVRASVEAGGIRPWVMGLCLLLVAFGFGCGGWILGLGSSLAGDGSRSGETRSQALVDGDKEAVKKIVIVGIQGVIMDTMGQADGTVRQVIESLKAIEKDKDVVGVLLAIDSPGGGVTASDRIYHELQEFKSRTKLPIHALFYDVAASGGYYVAMAADHITAHPTTVTGSIGVISKFYNVAGAMDKIGVSVNVVKSLNDKGEVSFKDMGSPFRPMRAEERALIQGLITEMWERFASIVTAGRKGHIPPERVRKLADGRVFTGSQALKEGLIDAIGYRQDAYDALRKACGHPEAKVVALKKPTSPIRELLGVTSHYEPSLVDLGPSLQAARQLFSERESFLYLWTAGSGLSHL